MRVGARFGAGVYVSPSFEKSDSYGFEDARRGRQMFVGVAAIGLARQIDEKEEEKGVVEDVRWRCSHRMCERECLCSCVPLAN